MALTHAVRRWLERIRVALVVAVLVLLATASLLLLLDREPPLTARSPSIPSTTRPPTAEKPTESPSSPAPTKTPSAEESHKIEFFGTANGSLRAVQWRTAVDQSQLVKISSSSWSLERSVEGRADIPIAQMTVQVIPPATYAGCRIKIDGRVAVSRTAQGSYRVAVCTA